MAAASPPTGFGSTEPPHLRQILLDLIDSSEGKTLLCLPRRTKSGPPSVRSVRGPSSDSADDQQEIFRTTNAGENWGSSSISTTHEHGTGALPENLSISELNQQDNVGIGIGTAHEHGTGELPEDLSISEPNQQDGVEVLKELSPQPCKNNNDLSIPPSAATLSDLQITTAASSPPESPLVESTPATPPDLRIATVSFSPQERQALESTLASPPGLQMPTVPHTPPEREAVESISTPSNLQIAKFAFSPSEARGRMPSSSSEAIVYTPATSVANDTEAWVTPPKSTMEEGGAESKAQMKKETNRRKKQARKKREQEAKAKDDEEETVLAQAAKEAKERRIAQVAGARLDIEVLQNKLAGLKAKRQSQEHTPSITMPGGPPDVVRPAVTLYEMIAEEAAAVVIAAQTEALESLDSGSAPGPITMPGARLDVARSEVTLAVIAAATAALESLGPGSAPAPITMPGAPPDPDVILGQIAAAAVLKRLASRSAPEPVAIPGVPPYVVGPDVTLEQIEAIGDAVGSGRAREETERDSLEELEAAMGMMELSQ
jgi:hypothetical protein